MSSQPDSEEPGAPNRLLELQRVTAALSAAATLEQVGGVINHQARSALDATTSALWAVRGTDLVLIAHFGHPPGYIDPFRTIPLDGALPSSAVVRTRQPRWVENEEQAREASAQAAEMAHAVGRLHGYAALPLMVQDQVVGIAAFGYDRWHRFSAGERAFAQTIASHCAQALERARLLDAEREASATFGAVFRSSHAAIMLLDADGTVRLWNPAAERMFGWTVDEV